MTIKNQIDQIAEIRGITDAYVDAWGNDACIVPETKAKLLKAMGYNVDDSEMLEQEIHQELSTQWVKLLPAVKVVRVADDYEIDVRVSIQDANNEYSWVLTTEQGDEFKGSFVPVDGNLVGVNTLEDEEFHLYKCKLQLEQTISLGYHNLTITLKDSNAVLGSCLYIVAPKEAYKPDAIKNGKKIWGTSVQLYSLRSNENWGIGDFTDLKNLVKNLGKSGADFVGLNPIHSLYPCNAESASPYSPSSRRWLNIIYIDVTSVDGYKESGAYDLANSKEFKSDLDYLKWIEYVDYSGVTKLKLQALRMIFNEFNKHDKPTDFKEFVEFGGVSLEQQATFDALQAYLYSKMDNAWGWPVWPEEFRSYDLPTVSKWATDHRDDVDFYLWLQYIADKQLKEVDLASKKVGMTLGIYRDLAVGVAEGGSDVWGNRESYMLDASIGAPPDVLGPLGQNWGLPPLNMQYLENNEYKAMIDLLRSNMRSCGALRIDHVLALLRLWLIPKGEGADKGAYVYNKIDDLLGILLLESHRNKCLIIGEDLGTIPDGIFETLQENGLYSYKISLFEQAEDKGFLSPAHYPMQAMAAVTTHDMPTLKGFWRCDDLSLGKKLGLYQDEEVLKSLYDSRHENKQRLLDSLHGHGTIPDYISNDVNYVDMDRGLNYGIQYHVALGNCSLVALQLEDWLEMDMPVNVPGTTDQYLNWRRKLNKNLDEIFSDHNILNLMNRLSEARYNASK